MTLILASSSPARATLLQSAGVPIESHAARIDEDGIRAALRLEDALPHDVADTLAEMKARRVAEKFPARRVLAADQVLVLNRDIHGKPDTRDEAAAQLSMLQGTGHKLISAAVIYDHAQPVWRAIGEARLTMHPLTARDIATYLDHAWPAVEGSVGAYHAEGYGARLFSRIEGDWFSVLGLPLLQVLSFLRQRGWLDP